jgi:hypothetical protein
LLRERLDWLVDLALAADFSSSEVASGHASALGALDRFQSRGRLMPECAGRFATSGALRMSSPSAGCDGTASRDGWATLQARARKGKPAPARVLTRRRLRIRRG